MVYLNDIFVLYFYIIVVGIFVDVFNVVDIDNGGMVDVNKNFWIKLVFNFFDIVIVEVSLFFGN